MAPTKGSSPKRSSAGKRQPSKKQHHQQTFSAQASASIYSFFSELTVDDLAFVGVMFRYSFIALAAMGVALIPYFIARMFKIFFGQSKGRAELGRAVEAFYMKAAGGAEKTAGKDGGSPTSVSSEGSSSSLSVSLDITPLTTRQHPLRIMVVLGSGGHTSEMLQSLALLGPRWSEHRCVYIVSDSDKDSAEAARVFEKTHRRFALVRFIPRARNVGQSYKSSIGTTLIALWRCFSMVFEEEPDVILTNGPGVCIPVVVSALLISTFYYPYSVLMGVLSRVGLAGKRGRGFGSAAREQRVREEVAATTTSPATFSGAKDDIIKTFTSASDASVGSHKRPIIAYFESFTCVDHISLSGKLLKPIADVFTVQWPQLVEGGGKGVETKAKEGVDGTSQTTINGAVASSRSVLAGPFCQLALPQAPDLSNGSGDGATSSPFPTSASSPSLSSPSPSPPSAASPPSSSVNRLSFLRPAQRSALITVGSTKFDDLISQVGNRAFLSALQRAKVARLYVQKGRSELRPLLSPSSSSPSSSSAEKEKKKEGSSTNAASMPSTEEAEFIAMVAAEYNIAVEIFDYRPNLVGTFMRRRKYHHLTSVTTTPASGVSPARTPTSMASAATTMSMLSAMGLTALATSNNNDFLPFSQQPDTVVDLLISHAGAGTILEAFGWQIPTIVVPNTKLMNNHQSVFAEELQRRGYLLCTEEASDVAAAVDRLVAACGGGDSDIAEDADVTSASPSSASPSPSLLVFPQPNPVIMHLLFAYMVGTGGDAQLADRGAATTGSRGKGY